MASVSFVQSCNCRNPATLQPCSPLQALQALGSFITATNWPKFNRSVRTCSAIVGRRQSAVSHCSVAATWATHKATKPRTNYSPSISTVPCFFSHSLCRDWHKESQLKRQTIAATISISIARDGAGEGARARAVKGAGAAVVEGAGAGA